MRFFLRGAWPNNSKLLPHEAERQPDIPTANRRLDLPADLDWDKD
jgi:hypothetical protein